MGAINRVRTNVSLRIWDKGAASLFRGMDTAEAAMHRPKHTEFIEFAGVGL